jgi:hypothetical protein
MPQNDLGQPPHHPIAMQGRLGQEGVLLVHGSETTD